MRRLVWFVFGGVCSLFSVALFAHFVLGSSPLQLDHKTCPFCDEAILHAQGFFEDEHVVALLNYRPLCPGHCLVIPKRHVTRLEEIGEEELLALFSAMKRVQNAVQQVYGYSDYSIVQKNGKNAFQTVGHIHFHLYPGFSRSPLLLFYRILRAQIAAPLSSSQLQTETEKLRERLAKSTW